MNLDSVDLTGIEYPTDDPDFPEAVRLQRCPEELRPKLNEGAQIRVLKPASGEIRFVTEDNKAQVTLSGVNECMRAVIFFGDFQWGGLREIPATPTTIEIEMPEKLASLDPGYTKDVSFNPHVIRILFRDGQVRLHNIEGTGLRPPTPEELPDKRLLCYGTSITHGGSASAPHLSYTTQLARRLKMDLVNLGLGGSCYCENEMADYIASRKDWDVATLALSVNMANGNFTLEEFAERVHYMVDRVAGAEILTDIGGLSPDLIHPADNGMIQMGEHLACKIQEVIE